MDCAAAEILAARDLETIEEAVRRWRDSLEAAFRDSATITGLNGLCDLVAGLEKCTDRAVTAFDVCQLKRKFRRCLKLLEPSKNVDEIDPKSIEYNFFILTNAALPSIAERDV